MTPGLTNYACLGSKMDWTLVDKGSGVEQILIRNGHTDLFQAEGILIHTRRVLHLSQKRSMAHKGICNPEKGDQQDSGSRKQHHGESQSINQSSLLKSSNKSTVGFPSRRLWNTNIMTTVSYRMDLCSVGLDLLFASREQ
jgi:hypothetical protein